ncbi:MAG: hypothetical protein ACPL1F_01415 [bacterium]
MFKNRFKKTTDKIDNEVAEYTYIDAGKFKDSFYVSIVNGDKVNIFKVKAKTHIEAEYLAFLNAYLIYDTKTIYLSDNEFVVKHYNKVYNSKILLYNLLRDHIKEAKIEWIPREKNIADKYLRDYFKRLKR